MQTSVRTSGSDGTEVRRDFKGRGCNLFPEFWTEHVDLGKDAGRQPLSETIIKGYLQQSTISISSQEMFSSLGVWQR